jgi:Tol biopolymer transport system component
VFVRGGDLLIYRRRGSTRLTAGRAPAWSTRNRILFFRDDGLYVIRPNGTGLTRLSASRLVQGAREADWSPDGLRIVIATRGGNIATMNADGTRLRRLTRSGSDSAPSFSPDGKKIVFARGDEDSTIMVMKSNGARRRAIREAEGDCLATDWQPLRRRTQAKAAPVGVH